MGGKDQELMSEEEILAMVGTTFIYHFPNGDTIPGVVAKFVPRKGLTCLATELATKRGEVFTPDKNGEVCLIAIKAPFHNILKEASFRMRKIRDTSHFYVTEQPGPSPTCGLS